MNLLMFQDKLAKIMPKLVFINWTKEMSYIILNIPPRYGVGRRRYDQT